MSFSSNIQNVFEWIYSEISSNADIFFEDSPPLPFPVPNTAMTTHSSLPCEDEAVAQYLSSAAAIPKRPGVSVTSLFNWQNTKAFPLVSQDSLCALNSKFMKEAPFSVSPDLNNKIYLFDGNIADLCVDMIVCFNNENWDFNEEMPNNVLRFAGAELLKALRHVDTFKSGEVCVTDGYNLHAKKIVHAISPRYNPKYDTASHNTLHGSYREFLKCAVEYRLRSIAFPCIFSRKRNFQLEACAHTVLRTVRRWLEHIHDKIDAVVFVSNNIDEIEIFQNLLSVYFPRNATEVEYARNYEVAFLGNQYGEIAVEDRRIRIGVIGGNTDKDDGPAESLSQHSAGKTTKTAATKRNDIMHSVDISFTESKSLSESERRFRIMSNVSSGDFSQEVELVYTGYLRDALAMIGSSVFKALGELRFIYHAGEDFLQRNIIVFCAALLPTSRFEWQHLLLYIIKTLDPYIRDKYVLIYVNAEVSVFANNPGISLFKEILSMYYNKYENTLDQLLVLFPGALFKTAFLCCWPFISSHVWNGTKYIDSIKELRKHCNVEQLQLPKYVFEFAAENDVFGLDTRI